MSTIESAYIKSKGLEDTDTPKTQQNKTADNSGSVQEKATTTPVSSDSHKPVTTRATLSDRGRVANMSQGNLFGLNELIDKHLVYAGMSDTVLLNKYRNLRTKLLARSNKENFITLVTSVVPAGGSSLVAANLAATFAFDESKTTLLVDANVMNPTLNKLLEVNADKGLIDYLQHEDSDAGDVIYETPIERLRFVPSGVVKENSSEYLSSERMRSFVRQVVSRYPNRYPIIDSPSITTSADTQILVDISDQVVLVIPYGMCSEEEIKYAAAAIGKEKLAGVILNEF